MGVVPTKNDVRGNGKVRLQNEKKMKISLRLGKNIEYVLLPNNIIFREHYMTIVSLDATFISPYIHSTKGVGNIFMVI